MRTNYIVAASLTVLLGIIMLILPKRIHTQELTPEVLLQEINGRTRFVTVDEITKKIIQKDQSIQLIDIRLPDEFKKFSLPGAINIPLKDILQPQYSEILNQDVKTNIFYSNGTIYANQAWVLCRRNGFKNNYVLEGGLNSWFEKIMLAPMPGITASSKELDLYKFRLSARSFFGGAGASAGASSGSQPAIQPSQSKGSGAPKKKAGGGGC